VLGVEAGRSGARGGASGRRNAAHRAVSPLHWAVFPTARPGRARGDPGPDRRPFCLWKKHLRAGASASPAPQVEKRQVEKREEPRGRGTGNRRGQANKMSEQRAAPSGRIRCGWAAETPPVPAGRFPFAAHRACRLADGSQALVITGRALSPGERYHRAALITGGYHLRGADRARARVRAPPRGRRSARLIIIRDNSRDNRLVITGLDNGGLAPGSAHSCGTSGPCVAVVSAGSIASIADARSRADRPLSALITVYRALSLLVGV